MICPVNKERISYFNNLQALGSQDAKFLGSGAYGKVYELAQDRVAKVIGPSNNPMAENLEELIDEYYDIYQNEIAILESAELQSVRETSFPTLIAYYSYPPCWCHKFEYTVILSKVPGECLYSVRYYRPEQFIDYKRLHSISIYFLQCLQDIHGAELIHGDIKPPNVMIDLKKESAHLIDAGGLCFLSEFPTSFRLENLATRGYGAPEIYNKEECSSEQCSVFSAAATLFYMFTGKQLFPNDKTAGNDDEMDEVYQSRLLDYGANYWAPHLSNVLSTIICPKEGLVTDSIKQERDLVVDFMKKGLAYNYEDRFATFSEALGHPLFSTQIWLKVVGDDLQNKQFSLFRNKNKNHLYGDYRDNTLCYLTGNAFLPYSPEEYRNHPLMVLRTYEGYSFNIQWKNEVNDSGDEIETPFIKWQSIPTQFKTGVTLCVDLNRIEFGAIQSVKKEIEEKKEE